MLDVEACGVEDGGGAGALQREGGDVLGHLGDVDLIAVGGVEEPREVAFLTAEEKVLRAVAEEGAVVDDLPGVVAPAGIVDGAHGEFRDVAGGQAVEEARGVGAGDAVFRHRAEVVDGRGVADGGVFHLDIAQAKGGLKPGPVAPAVMPVLGGDAGVEGRLDQRLAEIGVDHGRFSISAPAAFHPAVPERPPPGWLPAPPSQRPGTGVRYCAAPWKGRRNSICSTESSA